MPLLGGSMDRGAWWATVHGGLKELDMTEQLILSLSISLSASPKWDKKQSTHILLPTVRMCMCVYIYNSVEKAKGQCSSQVGTHETDSKKPLASQMALRLDYDLTQVSSQQS